MRVSEIEIDLLEKTRIVRLLYLLGEISLLSVSLLNAGVKRHKQSIFNIGSNQCYSKVIIRAFTGLDY